MRHRDIENTPRQRIFAFGALPMAEEDLVFERGDLIFKSEPFLAVLDKRWRFQVRIKSNKELDIPTFKEQ